MAGCKFMNLMCCLNSLNTVSSCWNEINRIEKLESVLQNSGRH